MDDTAKTNVSLSRWHTVQIDIHWEGYFCQYVTEFPRTFFVQKLLQLKLSPSAAISYFECMNMNYEQRLRAAAKIILDYDARARDAPLDYERLGLRVTLKPHQLEGVSWLIRRYELGVNVVLGEMMTLICYCRCIFFFPVRKVRISNRKLSF